MTKRVILITFVTTIFHLVSSSTSTTDNNSTSSQLEHFKELINNLDILSLLNKNTSTLEAFTNSTKQCVKAYKGINQDFVKYIDADAKPPAGLMAGDLYWLGNYKECMSVEHAHYCNIGKVKLTALKINIYLGMCVPDQCDVANVVEILRYVSTMLASKKIHIFTIEDNIRSDMTYNTDSACYKKTKDYSNGTIVMIFISSIIGFLCLLGTVVDRVLYYIKECRSNPHLTFVNDDDVMEQKRKMADDKVVSMHEVKVDKEYGLLVKFLLCFSLVKNSKALFGTTIPPGAITSINGIRTISITWVILGHTLIFGLGVTSNALDVFQWLPRFTMQAVLNAPVSVDTFFLLSGLLVSYLSMKRFQSKGKLSLLRYYLHRYIRLTPSYAYLLFFLAYIYPLLSDGPLWYMQASKSGQSETCVKYWWTNLLYINNFYPKLQFQCMNWSWYLANDMQFYVITPIITYAMYKFRTIGLLVANGVFLLACFITNGILMHTEHASPLFFDGASSAMPGLADPTSPITQYMMYLYEKPYTRISPYIVGVILGYILVNKKVINEKASRLHLFYALGWLLAIGTGLAVVYGPYSVTNYKWGETSTIFYGLFFRFVWAIAVGWVIYACHNGYGGLVNDMMSWSVFIPLSRLTYATYLIHPMVIDLFFFSTRTGVHTTLLTYSFTFVGVTTISFALAYVIAVCIEYPVLNLEKLIFKF